MNKTILYLIGLIVAGGIAVYFFVSGESLEKKPTTIDTTSWLTYESAQFNFRIKYPSDWTIYEDPNNPINPAFNFYPKEYSPNNLPLIHHSNTPNVSVFPNGVPTEGVFGETVDSNVTFTERPFRAFDFILENGDRWATFAGYNYAPDSWLHGGFTWAMAEVHSKSSACMRDDQELPVESCDFMGSNDKMIHRGEVNKEMRAIQKEILKSFKFTVQTTGDLIEVSYPKPGDTITSPLVITGQARGNWFWEANFPVSLTNWDGLIIAEWYAEAQLDPTDPESTWMTTEFVPFEAKLEFKNPSQKDDFTKNGYLILHKSNASGLPEHDDAIEIPIRFE